jgi:hypothetical protein
MAVQLVPYRFTVQDYHRMAEAGIFDEDARLELLDWAAFRRRQENEGDAWSPWCREQARQIEDAGLVPLA